MIVTAADRQTDAFSEHRGLEIIKSRCQIIKAAKGLPPEAYCSDNIFGTVGRQAACHTFDWISATCSHYCL